MNEMKLCMVRAMRMQSMHMLFARLSVVWLALSAVRSRVTYHRSLSYLCLRYAAALSLPPHPHNTP